MMLTTGKTVNNFPTKIITQQVNSVVCTISGETHPVLVTQECMGQDCKKKICRILCKKLKNQTAEGHFTSEIPTFVEKKKKKLAFVVDEHMNLNGEPKKQCFVVDRQRISDNPAKLILNQKQTAYLYEENRIKKINKILDEE